MKGVRAETASSRTALGRLLASLGTRGLKITLVQRRGESQKSLRVERPTPRGVKRITFSSHNSQLNLQLAAELAHASIATGGAGMTWDEIRNVTGWKNFNS